MKVKFDLAEILKSHHGERHLVVLHDFPDPDAISAAFTHRLISSNYGIETDIIYSGEISHQQNIALVRLLGINLQKFDPGLDFHPYQAVVFVDHQGTTVGEIYSALEEAKLPLLLVVDHHQPQEALKPEFIDIQQVGSTATIYAGYLEQGVIDFDSAIKDHVIAATALMHGIHSDTGGFIRATARDFSAAGFLSRFRDAELLDHILRQARSKHTMDIIHRALGNRATADSFSIAGIGYVRAENRDAIPQAADFLLSEENIHTTIVYGIVEDDERGEILIGSLRTSKLTLDPDQFLKEVLGKNEDGSYFGGGRPLAGGFAIPIGFLTGAPNKEYQQIRWDTYDQQIKHRIFAKIGIEVGTDRQ